MPANHRPQGGQVQLRRCWTDLYLNYAHQHWTKPGENPPVGLILCAEKGAAEAHYALDNLPNKVLAAEYQTVLHQDIAAPAILDSGPYIPLAFSQILDLVEQHAVVESRNLCSSLLHKLLRRPSLSE